MSKILRVLKEAVTFKPADHAAAMIRINQDKARLLKTLSMISSPANSQIRSDVEQVADRMEASLDEKLSRRAAQL